MDHIMKYATIGTSWITEAFIAGAQYDSHMELSAVYSRDIEKAGAFGAKFGCGVRFDDLEKLAAWDGIDAVYIASPNALHYSQSKLFLQNGKHVLCEKPVTVTAAEYVELAELADKNGLVYLEALIAMHHPERDKFARALKQIGNVTTARLDFSQLSSKYQSLMEGKNPNIFNPELAGGCLMDMGVYCFYPALDWFGMPGQIMASAGRVSTGGDGYLSGIFVYPDKQVLISLSKTGQSVVGCEILGDMGTITIGFIVEMRDVFIVKKDGQKERVFRNYSRTELMGAEAGHFYRYIHHKKEYEEEYRHMREQMFNVRRITENVGKTAGILPGYF
jgi:predicted dehydrogenase